MLFLATRDWYNPATTGGDNTLWENARYLASHGYDVTFAAAGYPGAAKTETVDGIHVVRLGGIHSLWLTTFIRYMRDWRGQFDVVIAEGFGGSRIPRLSPLYVTEPMITEWHQIHRKLFAIQYPALINGLLNALERITAWVHRNSLIRAGTDEWKQAFPKIGFKPENVFVVPVSIRDDWLADSNGTRSNEPNILWLGKLRRYKCPDHIIRAMPAILDQVKDARLVIAGRRDDVRYERELRSLTAKLGVNGSVEFRFDLSEGRKRRLIHESHVMVLPSVVEGFGIVVLEANACGVPVIASSGVPEGAVREGFNGLRYKFGDIQALADRIVQVLQDPVLYSTLSTNASSNAKRFSWSRVGAEFEKVVRQLSNSAQSAR